MGFRNVSFCHTILPSLLLPICLSSLHFSHFDLFSPVHSLFNKRLFVIAILTTKGNTLALERQGPLGMCKTVTAWCSSITEQVCIDDKKRHVRSNTSPIDLKCKRGGSVARLCDRHERSRKTSYSYPNDHKHIAFPFPPVCFPPQGQGLTCLVRWDSWGQGQWVIPPPCTHMSPALFERWFT